MQGVSGGMARGSDVNPYEPPHAILTSAKKPHGMRSMIAWSMFGYSVVAIGVTCLAPLLLFLLFPEKLATDAVKNTIDLSLHAVFVSGLAANITAILIGNTSIRLASVPIVILNAAILLRFAGPIINVLVGCPS